MKSQKLDGIRITKIFSSYCFIQLIFVQFILLQFVLNKTLEGLVITSLTFLAFDILFLVIIIKKLKKIYN